MNCLLFRIGQSHHQEKWFSRCLTKMRVYFHQRHLRFSLIRVWARLKSLMYLTSVILIISLLKMGRKLHGKI